MSRTTLVLGASTDPSRYAFAAIHRLRRQGMAVVAIGLHEGTVADVPITQDWPAGGIDTVTMYIRPALQPACYDCIMALRPRRVIFNPGTENMEFSIALMAAGIHVEEACTLVMLGSGTY